MAQTSISMLLKRPSTTSTPLINPGSSPAVSSCKCISTASTPSIRKARTSTRSSRSMPTRSKKPTGSTRHTKSSGPVGPLHGIPVIVKDQADVKGMPTTLGLAAIQRLFSRSRFIRRRKVAQGRRGDSRQSHARRAWAAATRMARCSVRHEILTTSSAPSAVLRAARRHRCRRISRPSPSARKGWRRSADRRLGTASPACVRPPVWSAAAASTVAGRKSSAPSARWRAAVTDLAELCWTSWSATIPKTRSRLAASANSGHVYKFLKQRRP